MAGPRSQLAPTGRSSLAARTVLGFTALAVALAAAVFGRPRRLSTGNGGCTGSRSSVRRQRSPCSCDESTDASLNIGMKTFTAGTVGVAIGEQTVISQGPYRVVGHPVDAGALLMLLATPIALGSCWALTRSCRCWRPLFGACSRRRNCWPINCLVTRAIACGCATASCRWSGESAGSTMRRLVAPNHRKTHRVRQLGSAIDVNSTRTVRTTRAS